MGTWLLIAIFLTEFVKYGVWFRGIRGLAFTRRSIGGLIGGIYIALICMGVVNDESLLLLWGIVNIIIFSIIVDCGKGERILLVGEAALIVISAGEVICEAIRMIKDASVIAVDKPTYLLGNILAIAVFAILSEGKRRVKFLNIAKAGIVYRGIAYVAITVMGIAILLVVTGFQRIARLVEEDGIHIFSRVISMIAYICIICFIFIIAYIFRENKRYKQYLEKEAMLVRLQKNMYEAMLLKNEETRRFRHDMQNHFICLNELAKDGEVEKVQGYISEIAGKLNIAQKKIFTVGNSVVDAVLNYYISMLPTEAEVEVEGICAPEIGISDFELCIIVSNLVQNAEEALKKDGLRERYLKIEFGQKSGYAWIEMKNSIVNDSVVLGRKNGIPQTTKQNSEEHGIGIRNVREAVEKNGGMMKIDVTDKAFVIKAMLPLKSVREGADGYEPDCR